MSIELKLRGVTYRVGKKVILDNVDVTVPAGGVFLFGGQSGCGKSSFLEICAGHLRPSMGKVLWNGANVSSVSKYDMYDRRKSIGYVFQVHALIANHSVFDNIELPLKCGTTLSAGERREKVYNIMDELNIDRACEKNFPEVLPVATLKSIAIARALVNDPKLLFIDEPFSSVDPISAKHIRCVLYDRWKQGDMTVVMSAQRASAWPDGDVPFYTLEGGRLVR